MLVDLNAGPNSSWPDDLTVVGDTLFFAATTATAGYELWKTDGTPEGTVMVTDLQPGAAGSFPSKLMAWGDTLLFEAVLNSRSLWRSRGTPATTIQLRPFFDLFEITPAGSRAAYLHVQTSRQTHELAVTDGTPNGTTIVQRPRAGLAAWEPLRLTWSGQHLYFMADDSQAGRELWVVDLGATAQPVGVSCADPTQMLRLSSDDPVLGTTVVVTGAGSLPGTSGALLLGAPGVGFPLASACYFYLQPAGLAVLAPVQAVGSSWTVSVPLPNVPALAGVRAGLQAVLGPTSVPVGADVTNSVLWTLGF